MLHVDILDGYFSPSMPIGVDMVKQLRKKCDMDFDVHIMAVENDFFIKEMIDAGAQRICFHVETERHITKKLTEIKKAGIQAGIALMPATSPEQFEYALELCDFVVLMRINPGYASSRDEKEYSFVTKKMCRLSDMIARENYSTTIGGWQNVFRTNMRTYGCRNGYGGGRYLQHIQQGGHDAAECR